MNSDYFSNPSCAGSMGECIIPNPAADPQERDQPWNPVKIYSIQVAKRLIKVEGSLHD